MEPGNVHIPEERDLKPLAALIIFLLSAAMFCSYLTENRVKVVRNYFYFVPPIKYLSLAGGTHRTLLGYLFFIRGILDLHEPLPSSVNRMDYLLANFRAAGTLEPKLTRAFFFGGIVVPVTREDMTKAIRFLEEQERLSPDRWEFPFWIGLNYLESGDYPKAAEYYQKAARQPASPDYLKTNLAFLYYKSGEFGQGVAYLQALLSSLDNQRLIEIVKRKIEWLSNLAFLESKLDQYYRAYGKWPVDLNELQSKGLLKEVPADTFGRGFYLERGAEGVKPNIRSRH
jgi:TPR repeat protein